MADTLYDRDFYAWTQSQAQALRRRGAGGNALDYDNLAEEIGDVGKSELHACASQIENIVEHLLKIQYVGPRKTIPHWKGELRAFRRALGRKLTPTIRRQLQGELDSLFEDILREQVEREAIREGAAAKAGGAAYSWEQITDPDFVPQPTYD